MIPVQSDFKASVPREPRYDRATRTWIVSRFADVSSALKESALVVAAASGEAITQEGNPEERSENASRTAADVLHMLDGCREAMNDTARKVVYAASALGRADLVFDVAHKWSVITIARLCAGPGVAQADIEDTARALLYEGVDRSNRTGLRRLARPLANRWSRRQAEKAKQSLKEMVGRGEIRATKSMFIGTVQTLPSFLSKAWLTLLENPDQAALLKQKPGTMGTAIEELLRYAGIVHTLYRQARRDVRVGEMEITAGDFVVLKVDSANFDEQRFPNPYRLDIGRRPVGHLGLGAGIHSCAGAVMVREAFATLTPMLLAANPRLDAGRGVLWTADHTLRWPVRVPVRLG